MIVKPCQIVLGGAQFQLGLVAPCVKPRGACRFIEQGAPLPRLRSGQGADPSLSDQRTGKRPGRRIGEQQMHVAGARLSPIDPECRAGAAHNSTRDLDRRRVIERQRCVAQAIVEAQRNFGEVARRTAFGTAVIA